MTSAIIVAAGRGTRMGLGVDKIFLVVAGRPVVAHTWARFEAASCVDEIVLVVRDGLQTRFEQLGQEYGFRKAHRFVAGGPQRQDSVWNGLESIDPQAEIVAVQDAARPCTSPALIEATVAAAREVGAAVAARRVTDTIKESDGGTLVTRTVDRARLWAVQTPQTFRVAILRAALMAAREKGLQLTDDTAACELIRQPVKLVEETTPNPKVTVPADLPYVEIVFRAGGVG
jgi:2-C-methyl-D-erythritol 4-phosphate cytidylyltransferase